MAESPIALLRAHARFSPWNARGLAAHVAGLVDAVGMKPTNAVARAAPSARAVRFYVANKLMDRPEGAGTSATYNYRHFLQLLGIKIRQREGFNLDAIRKEMADTTGDALERRLATWLGSTLAAQVPTAVRDDELGTHSWRRVTVADGVELHLRNGSAAASDDGIATLREGLRAALGRIEPS
jgi:DNA-binding transcriptional MerR regulator